METEKLLKTYRAKLATEAWLRSLLCGLIVGLALNVLCSLTFWFFGIKTFWVSVAVFAAATAAATPIFYFAKYRLNGRQVASRVDTLGLEERILTMTQLEGDDSFMARRQREDATAALKTVNESLIKIVISIPLIVCCGVLLLAGAGSTTVSAVAERSLLEIIENRQPADPGTLTRFSTQYGVQDGKGGHVEGPLEQSIVSGGHTSPVQAIPDPGFIFVGWTDGCDDDYRIDADMAEDIRAFAIFVAAELPEDQEYTDEVPDSGDGSGESRKGEKGKDGKKAKPGEQEQEGDSPNPDAQQGQAGTYNPTNQIVDGETYYGGEYSHSYAEAQDAMNSNTNITEDENSVIGDYFNNIAK